MANEIQEVEAGARINHLVYRDVYNTTFDKDVIVDFEMEDDGHLSGMCQTDKYGWLPVFYHCKKHCYDESVRTLRENKSLKCGELAFEVESEVQVLLEEGNPKYVVGHFEQHDPPCMCKDIFRVYADTHGGGVLESYFVASTDKVLEGGVDYYGDTPLCEREELILYEYWKIWSPTYYNGHKYSMIRIGPMLYVLVFSEQWYVLMGCPEVSWYWWGPDVYTYGAWTQKKEDALVTAGQNPFQSGDMWFINLPEEDKVYLEEFSLAVGEELSMLDFIEGDSGMDVRTIKFFGQSDEEE